MAKKNNDEGGSSNSSEYEVGYQKPPKTTQFKPGVSGNPKGRPKRSKNMNTLFNNELDRVVTVKEQGKRHEISKREAIVKRMVNEAVNGNVSAVKTLMGVLGTDPEVDPNDLVDDDDAAALERFAEKIRREMKSDK